MKNMSGALILVALLLLSPSSVAVTLHVSIDGQPVAAAIELVGNGTSVRALVVNGTANITVEPGNYTAYVYSTGNVYVFNVSINENTTDLYLNITTNQTDDTPISSYTHYGWLGLNMVLILVILVIVGLVVAASRLPRRL